MLTMIYPNRHWQAWGPLRQYSFEIWRDSLKVTLRQCPGSPLTPEIAARQFAEEEEAFLNDTANVLGMTRSEMEQAAAAGRIEWRECFETSILQTRHGDVRRDMTIAHWIFWKEPQADWQKRMKAIADNPPR